MCSLLSSKHPLLPTLAAKFPFETAIGVNGRIWVKADTVGRTIALGRMIEAVDSGALAVDESKGGIERHLKAIGGVD
jgi:exosome complex component RRP40